MKFEREEIDRTSGARKNGYWKVNGALGLTPILLRLFCEHPQGLSRLISWRIDYVGLVAGGRFHKHTLSPLNRR